MFWCHWNSFIYISGEIKNMERTLFSTEILCKMQKSFYVWTNILKMFIWDTETFCSWACLPRGCQPYRIRNISCPQTPLDSLNSPLWIWWSNIFTFLGGIFSIFSLNHFLRRFHKLVATTSDCSVPLFKLQIMCPFVMEFDGKFCLRSRGALLPSLHRAESYCLPEVSTTGPGLRVQTPGGRSLAFGHFGISALELPQLCYVLLESKHHSTQCANGFQFDS